MTTGAKIMLGLFLLCLVIIGAQTWRLVNRDRRITALELAPQQQATVTAQAKVETVTVQLAARIGTVTRMLQRALRTDTLVLRPATATDTATALAQLPVLAASYDTLTRSCSALAVTCAEYRTAAEQRFRADSVYRVGLEAALRGAAPSRFGAIWQKVKIPLALAGGVCLGRMSGGKPCLF